MNRQPSRIPSPFAMWVQRTRYRIEIRLSRYRRAWRYARNTLSADDAQWIFTDCEYAAGWHTLLVLGLDRTLERARERYEDHPDLPRLVNDGCARVASKWEDYSDNLSEAEDSAIERAVEYAEAEGITLTSIDDED